MDKVFLIPFWVDPIRPELVYGRLRNLAKRRQRFVSAEIYIVCAYVSASRVMRIE